MGKRFMLFLLFCLLMFSGCSIPSPTIERRTEAQLEGISGTAYREFEIGTKPLGFFEITDCADYASFELSLFQWEDNSWQKIHDYDFSIHGDPLSLAVAQTKEDARLSFYASSGSHDSHWYTDYAFSTNTELHSSSIDVVQTKENEYVPIMVFYADGVHYSFDDFYENSNDTGNPYYFLCISFQQVKR